MQELAKILLVDDEYGIRETIGEILEEENYRVTKVEDGHKAINLIQKKPFNIVITDIRMPGISGIEILESTKKMDPDTEVIIITGYASLESSIEALNLGAFSYIIKPINIDELKATIKNALAKQRYKIENRRLFRDLQEAYDKLKNTQQELEKWLRALSILYKVSEEICAGADPEQVINLIITSLDKIIDHYISGLLLFKEERGRMWLRVPLDAPSANIKSVKSSLLKAISELTNEERTEENLSVKLERREVSFDKEVSIKNFFNVPIVIDSKPVGILSVTRVKEESFNEMEVGFLYSMSREISLLIKQLGKKGV